MTPKQPVVHGGGWYIREIIGRPRLRFFVTLSILWLPVSMVASLLVWLGATGSSHPVHWACIVLTALEPLFILACAVLWLVEKPVKFLQRLPNTDYDPRNLY